MGRVEDVDGDFHFAKREETGTWLNTGLHYQAWAAIQAAGEYSSANWVVKLDADAVMIPSRLKYWLSDKYVPPGGMYLENCKYVKYGWFGSLEIFSAAAFETLYCFSVVMQDTGSTKKYYDLELVQGQYDKGVSIFGCDSWGVFSDAD